MSEKKLNPYRDDFKIDVPDDEIPSDYQLLGLKDFESDEQTIQSAYARRMEQAEQLKEQLISAKDNLSNDESRAQYDEYLCRTGRAGLPHLGWLGVFMLLFSFAASIVLVLVSTFYIYPMVVVKAPEPIGDSVTTLPNYQDPEDIREKELRLERQKNITTMDVNVYVPIVDDYQTPLGDIPLEETSVPVSQDAPENALPEPETESDTEVNQPAVELEESAPEAAPVEENSAEALPLPVELPPAEPVLPATPSETPEAVPQEAAPPTIAFPHDAAEEGSALIAPGEIPSAENTEAPVAPSDPQEPAVISPDPAASALPGKSACPTSEQIAAVVTQIEQENELNSNLTQDQRSAKSAALLDKGVDAAISSEMRFALLSCALNQANRAGDAVNAMRAIDALASGFQYNQTEAMLDSITQCAGVISKPEEAAGLLTAAAQAENILVEQRDFQNALIIAEAVYKTCSQSALRQSRGEALRQLDSVKKFGNRWSLVQQSYAAFSQSAQPDESADIIATWKFEVEKDWSAALPYLTRSLNERIRAAAQKETSADASNAENCKEIADMWWNIAQEPIQLQKYYKSHAGEWYKRALPSVTDKQTKTLIESRLAQIE